MSRLGICLWLFAALLVYGVAAAESDATTSAASAAREYSMPGGSGRGAGAVPGNGGCRRCPHRKELCGRERRRDLRQPGGRLRLPG